MEIVIWWDQQKWGSQSRVWWALGEQYCKTPSIPADFLESFCNWSVKQHPWSLVKSTFLRQMVPKIILKSSQIIPKSSHLHPNHPNHPKPIQHSIHVPTFFPLFARKPRPPTSTVRRRARRGDHCASLRARETNLWPWVHHVLGWKICGSVGNLWGFCKDLMWFNGYDKLGARLTFRCESKWCFEDVHVVLKSSQFHGFLCVVCAECPQKLVFFSSAKCE